MTMKQPEKTLRFEFWSFLTGKAVCLTGWPHESPGVKDLRIVLPKNMILIKENSLRSRES